MKVLFFIECLHSGGKERRMVELIKGLYRNYKDFSCEVVITKEGIHYDDILNLNIKIHIIKRSLGRKDITLFYKFYKIASNYKPDIINVWGNLPAIYAIPTKLILGCPMINNEITDAPLTIRSGFLSHKLTFPFSDRIIANSYQGLRSYDAPKDRSIVIYNGFDFGRINVLARECDIRDKYNIRTKYVVAMVASFTDKKDYLTYVKSANRVIQEIKDVSFLCIGSGDDSEYRKKVDSNKKDRVIFTGRQSNVESIMGICDIGVLTSNVHKHGEGISNSLLEFMAIGKPVIATNNGGTPELMDDSVTGYLIDPYDDYTLSLLVMRLIMDESLRQAMGVAAKKKVEGDFSINKMVENFYNEYNAICKKVN